MRAVRTNAAGFSPWILGGAFLVFCDTLARVVIAPTELPVGILTALLGGPFFLWLLLSRAGRLETLQQPVDKGGFRAESGSRLPDGT